MAINPFLAIGNRFQDASVVERYHLRLAYPTETFDLLLGLITDTPRALLDVGTGPGVLARQLVEHVDRVDAVDPSAVMLARGKTLPNGQHPNLRWLHGRIEDVALNPPYALITMGECLIWLDWNVVFPRFAALLSPHGYVAQVERSELPPPWRADLLDLIRRYSTMKHYPALQNVVTLLEEAKLFSKVGERETAPVTTRQSVADYIASFHSRSSLSLEQMPPEEAAAFDERLRSMVEPWSRDGMLELQTVASVVWGKPLRASPETPASPQA
ncbi:MAG TPA: class I SAM-dependent methyltransferase [Ktedonobacterales bacterium]|nr:class I SAM-dependent methyltransferase [Ktedonobacterales bacterium]